MQRKRTDVDVIQDILTAAIAAYPASGFLQSLQFQYQERGGLSKKQLEGLYKIADKSGIIPAAKLATLEAEILKRPNRYKSALPPVTPLYEKDKETGEMIDAILQKNPQHKRVLYFKIKYENNEPLATNELSELKKFAALFQKKG